MFAAVMYRLSLGHSGAAEQALPAELVQRPSPTAGHDPASEALTAAYDERRPASPPPATTRRPQQHPLPQHDRATLGNSRPRHHRLRTSFASQRGGGGFLAAGRRLALAVAQPPADAVQPQSRLRQPHARVHRRPRGVVLEVRLCGACATGAGRSLGMHHSEHFCVSSRITNFCT